MYRLDVLEKMEPTLLEVKPWFFGCDTDWDNPNRKITLAHVVYRERFTSLERYFMRELSRNFDTSRISRCYYNCFRKYDDPGFHTDPGGCTYMFYLNHEWDESWGGHTEFKSVESGVPKTVAPKPGRLIIFDARWIHRGTQPSSIMPNRIVGRLSIACQEQ